MKFTWKLVEKYVPGYVENSKCFPLGNTIGPVVLSGCHFRYSARLDSIEGRICVEHEERLEKESFIVWAAWAARWKDVNEKAAGMIRSCEEDRVRGAWEAWKTYRKNWKEKERKVGGRGGEYAYGQLHVSVTI